MEVIKNDLEYKVKINNKDIVPLYMLEIDIDNLTSKEIEFKRPISYHEFSYDTKSNQYKSIKNYENKKKEKEKEEKEQEHDEKAIIIIKNQYLYSSNLKYKYETGWEMCFIGRDNQSRGIAIWSWEFDPRLEITNLFINMLFMTFDSNSIINWYISTKSNEAILKESFKRMDSHEVYSIITDQLNFTLLPLNLPTTPIHFDKKLDLTDYLKLNNKNNNNNNATRFFLACVMENNKNDRTQLFRCKSSNYFKKFGTSNTNPNQHPDPIYDYPFTIHFNLSQKSTITNQLIGEEEEEEELDYTYNNNNNHSEDCRQNNNKFNQLNNFYYFNEEDESIELIRKIKLSKIHKWDNERVLQWLFDIQVYSLIRLFKELRIDGIKLLTFQIELLPISFTENNIEKLKFIKELSKLLLISGQRNEILLKSIEEEKQQKFTQFQHQYNQSKSTILSLKSNLIQNKKLIRKIKIKNNNNNKEEEEIKLLNDENTSNCQLIIQGRIFKAHKEVLIKSSEYFKTILTCESFEESTNGVINFECDIDLTSESLRIILELIYMQTNDIQLEFLKNLGLNQLKSTLILSDRFLLVDSVCKLSQLIENFIIWKINSKNINLINIADTDTANEPIDTTENFGINIRPNSFKINVYKRN
ncbi:hypothetical protein ACTFIW_009807 [Dictyostelium discoideum]